MLAPQALDRFSGGGRSGLLYPISVCLAINYVIPHRRNFYFAFKSLWTKELM